MSSSLNTDWGFDSAGEDLPSMHGNLSSIPSTTSKQINNEPGTVVHVFDPSTQETKMEDKEPEITLAT